MKNLLKDKGIGYYLDCVAALLALIVAIAGPFMNGFAFDQPYFTAPMVILLVVGFVLQVASLWLRLDFMPILITICFGTVLGMSVLYGLPTISDQWNGMVVMGGDINKVVFYLVMLGVATILSVIVSFIGVQKKATA